MCRYSNGQISLMDFKQPVGMNLKESNVTMLWASSQTMTSKKEWKFGL